MLCPSRVGCADRMPGSRDGTFSVSQFASVHGQAAQHADRFVGGRQTN